MNEDIRVFNDYEIVMKNLKKAKYIKNMDVFKEKYAKEIISITGLETSEKYDHEGFVDSVFERYKFMGKVGKLKKHDLSLFMIYFLFPAMLLAGKDADMNEKAKESCDSLLTAWNKKFEMDIKYIDYNSLLAGFSDKMFGIFKTS